jgi:hypothetical protein
LERLEPGNKHVRQLEQPRSALVVLIIPTKDSTCYQLTEVRSGDIDCLMVGLIGLLAKELYAVDE